MSPTARRTPGGTATRPAAGRAGARRPPVVPAGPRLAARARAQRLRRLRRAGRRTVLAAAVLAPVLALAWLLLSSPLLVVRHVVVSGTGRLTTAQVTSAAGVAAGRPLARVDTDAAAARVAALPAVSRVRVTRAWPRTLRLKVTERAAVAAVAAGAGVVLVDASGVPFAAAATAPAGVVRLQVARPGPADAATTSALRVLAELPEALRARVAAVRASTPDSVTLVLRDRRQVVWGSPGDAPAKAAAAQALLPMRGTVYDVSAPGLAVRR